jgi:hypothetical protein
MAAQKLNYRFHNPNSGDKTADYILRILVKSNKVRLENTIKKAEAPLRTEKHEYSSIL